MMQNVSMQRILIQVSTLEQHHCLHQTLASLSHHWNPLISALHSPLCFKLTSLTLLAPCLPLLITWNLDQDIAAKIASPTDLSTYLMSELEPSHGMLQPLPEPKCVLIYSSPNTCLFEIWQFLQNTLPPFPWHLDSVHPIPQIHQC